MIGRLCKDERMNAPTELLLDGPRGRRLCLELAMELNPRVRSAAFWLAYELDPGKGTSTVLFALSNDGPGTSSGTPDAASSLAELTAAVRSIDASDLTTARLAAALEGTVKYARYWQEPDGEDVLAAQTPRGSHGIGTPTTTSGARCAAQNSKTYVPAGREDIGRRRSNRMTNASAIMATALTR